MLTRLSEPAVFAIIVLILVAPLAAGFVLGLRETRAEQERAFLQLSNLQLSLLGLLALLLGFSFSTATTRWELRKQALIDEANAIGTTYLRTSLLPDSERKDVAALLVEYVDVRLSPETMDADPSRRAQNAAQARQLHARLWRLAMTAVAADPRPVTTGLFVPSLNAMIDAHGKSVALIEDRVPQSILWLLLVVAMGATGLTGITAGLTNVRNLVAGGLVSLLIAFVMLLIVDLDRPARGLIRVSQANLRDLRASMTAGPATSPGE
jgi:hypothetical protein